MLKNNMLPKDTEQCLDIALAISLVKHKHTHAKSKSINEIIENFREGKESEPSHERKGQFEIEDESQKLQMTSRYSQRNRHRIRAKNIVAKERKAVPSSFKVDQKVAPTSHIQRLQINSANDLRYLLRYLQHVVRLSVIPKQLQVIKQLSLKIKSTPKKIVLLLIRNKDFGWKAIQYSLQKCLIYMFVFSNQHSVDLKADILQDIQQHFLKDTIGRAHVKDELLLDLELIISKLLLGSRLNKDIWTSTQLTRKLEGVPMGQTMQLELSRFAKDRMSFYETNPNLRKFTKLLLMYVKSPRVMKSITKFYLKLLSCYLRIIKPCKSYLTILRKNILTLLIFQGDRDLISLYHSIDFDCLS